MKRIMLVLAALTVMSVGASTAMAGPPYHHHHHPHTSFGFSYYGGPRYYPYAAYPAPVYAYPAPVYTYPAPAYAYPAPAYVAPPPVYYPQSTFSFGVGF